MSDLEILLAGLRAAGERTRLRLLFLLSHGELNVKELTQILGQSQPRISRHLKLLCEAGLLERHREGSWVLFRLSDAGVPGALSRLVVDMTPSNSAEIQRDLRRLDDVRKSREASASEYFRQNAGSWDTIRSLHVAEEEVECAILAACGDSHVPSLLDLGTGTGRLLELLEDRIDQGIGIDTSHAMLAIARTNLQRRQLAHCQVRHGDLFNLPYDNSSFDLITVHQVLHYLNDPERALQEAARVLKADGRMLIVDFAPHEVEFLRDKHAHRRLGIGDVQMQIWLTKAGLTSSQHQMLPPPDGEGKDGLTVSVWMAHGPEHNPPTRRTESGTTQGAIEG